MSDRDDFALVPRAPSSLESAEPGAKRILSGMVADTLAMAKREPPAKPTFTVLIGHRGLAGDSLEMLTKMELEKEYSLRFFRFGDDLGGSSEHESELLALAGSQPFDLILARWSGASPELFALVKARYGKPIILTTGYPLPMMDRGSILTQIGIPIITVPFDVKDFWSALRECLRIPLPVGVKEEPSDKASNPIEPAARPTGTKPLRIIMVDDVDTTLEAIKFVMQYLLPEATILAFQWAGAGLKEVERQHPDLFTTDWNHAGMPGAEILERLAAMKVKCPVFVLSAYAEMAQKGILLRDYVAAGLNVTLLSKPFTVEELRALLLKHLGPGQGLKLRKGAL